MVESISDPANDPVIFWFSGGPGGVSTLHLLFGHGPYSIDINKQPPWTAEVNPYAWNNKSTMIYVDNPAGVGYSHAGRESDYITNDY